jgi:hypothetical protein
MPPQSLGLLVGLYLVVVGLTALDKIFNERNEHCVFFVHCPVHKLEMFLYKQLDALQTTFLESRDVR